MATIAVAAMSLGVVSATDSDSCREAVDAADRVVGHYAESMGIAHEVIRAEVRGDLRTADAELTRLEDYRIDMLIPALDEHHKIKTECKGEEL
ncbi:hypothetical protein Q7C18_02865 [Nesterenkonia sp. CL21]|uniref:hypothetical protein n=1 Tax=Nesterenkonia sp. CL21 TaxID=3064894 RepID=UPI002878CCB0|nr:hypothetical protein [Nesterenkonia sp. CL21]MDS2171629.1 hypothetical protein [Nesterenkonia sp. CL21]